MSDKAPDDEAGVPNAGAPRDDDAERAARYDDAPYAASHDDAPYAASHAGSHDDAPHAAPHDGAEHMAPHVNVEHAALYDEDIEGRTMAQGSARYRPFAVSLGAGVCAALLQPPRLWRQHRSVRLAAIGAAIAVAAFAIGAFVVVPILVDRAVRQFDSSSAERVASVERVRVAPFTLTIDLEGGAVEDPTAGSTLTFDRVRLNFGFAALLQDTVVFDELSVERPTLRVDVANGNVSASVDSLRELLVELTERPVRIDRLVIDGGRVEITDRATDRIRTLGLHDIAVSATDLARDSGAPSNYVVSVRDASGAALHLDGTLTTAGRAAQGTLSAQGVDLAGLVEWLGAETGDAPTSGILVAAASYAWRPDIGLELTAASGSVSAPRFELVPGIAAEASMLQFEGAAKVSPSDPNTRITADGDFELIEAVIANRDGDLLTAERIAASGAVLQPLSAGEAFVGLTIDALRLERPRIDVSLDRRSPQGSGSSDTRTGASVTLGLLGSVRHPLDDLVTFSLPSTSRPVAVRRAEVIEGRVSVLDRGVSPLAPIDVSDVRGMLGSAASTPTLSLTVTEAVDGFVVDLEGRVGERGAVTLQSRVGAAEGGPQTVELVLRDADAEIISPYFAAMAGRALAAGYVDLDLDYRVGRQEAGPASREPRLAEHAGETTIPRPGPAVAAGESGVAEPTSARFSLLRGELRIAARDLSLGPAAAQGESEAPPAASSSAIGPLQQRERRVDFDGGSAPPSVNAQLRWDLGLALLQDRTGRMELTLPLAHDAAAALGPVIADALRDHAEALTAEPFEIVAEIASAPAQALRSVTFGPGDATPHPSSSDSLTALAAVFDERPRLGLRVAGRADRALDRDALAAQQIELHVTLATAGLTTIARPKPIDFTSPRAWDVLDEFASERLSDERLATIASYFTRDTSGRVAEEEKESYYRALFDALVANEPIPENALRRLARYRAQSVADALTALGVAAGRVELEEERVTDANGESAGQIGQSEQPAGPLAGQPLIEVPLSLQSAANLPHERAAEPPDVATVRAAETESDAPRADRPE